jgi:hypothetical protein
MGKNNLDQLFQKGLGDMAISPSDAAKKVFSDRISYHRRIGLIKKIGIAASILIVIGAGFLGFYQLKEQTPRIALKESAYAVENELDLFEGIDNNRIAIPLTKIDQNIESSEMLKGDAESFVKGDQVNGIDTPVNQEPAVMLAVAYMNESQFDLNGDMKEIENEIIAENQVEGRLIEYYIIDPESNPDEQLAANKPLKITIEYKFSGKKSNKESIIKKIYSKIDNMKPADEVFGDLRTLKDKVFALNFKKEKKVENPEKSE